MFGRSWSVQCSHRPRGVWFGKGLRAQRGKQKGVPVPEGGSLPGGVGEGEGEGNASLGVRLQEGLLPADKAKIQEQGHVIMAK